MRQLFAGFVLLAVLAAGIILALHFVDKPRACCACPDGGTP